MTQSSTPTIHCDGDDSFCGMWDIDHYKTCASKVGGTRITQKERSPGWVTVGDEDYCPEHKDEVTRSGNE